MSGAAFDDLIQKRAQERAEFRVRLMVAADQPEFVRSAMIPIHLRDNLEFHQLPEEELFRAIYGSQGAFRFWEVECAEPISIVRFLKVMTCMVSKSYQDGQAISQAIAAAVLAASQSGEQIIAGPARALDAARAAEYGHQLAGIEKLKISVKATSEWMLRSPKRAHLVPESLAKFLGLQNNPATPARHTPPPAVKKPTQEQVNRWILDLHKSAKKSGDPPPKREGLLESDYRATVGAREAQVEIALRQVPASLKRGRGQK